MQLFRRKRKEPPRSAVDNRTVVYDRRKQIDRQRPLLIPKQVKHAAWGDLLQTYPELDKLRDDYAGKANLTILPVERLKDVSLRTILAMERQLIKDGDDTRAVFSRRVDERRDHSPLAWVMTIIKTGKADLTVSIRRGWA